jgi:hypothetical protein
MKSNEINELAKGLILFHVKCEGIKKDAKNPFFKSTYASLPKIIEAITEPLAESGLALTMFPIDENSLYCLLMHTSGQWIEATYTMKPVKETPQDKGSCLTYMRRYCVSSILNLQIDDFLFDDDANKASGRSEIPPPTGGYRLWKNKDTTETRSFVNDDGKAWLNKGTPEFEKAIKYVQGGGLVAKIKEKYRLNKEIETLFLAINKEVAP